MAYVLFYIVSQVDSREILEFPGRAGDLLEALDAMIRDNQPLPARALIVNRKGRSMVSSWMEPLQQEADLGYEVDYVARYVDVDVRIFHSSVIFILFLEYLIWSSNRHFHIHCSQEWSSISFAVHVVPLRKVALQRI
jgi:hypothetical protein